MNLKLENVVLIIATLSSFFTVFLSSALTIAVPSIASEFSMNNILQNWVTMVFFLLLQFLQFQLDKFQENMVLKSLWLWQLFYILLVQL